MATEKPVRCEVVFRGRVQGVGFRHATTAVASQYPITGYVMNLRDGGVRLVAEGLRETVTQLIQGVGQEMGGYISDQQVTWTDATGEFPSFGVRYEGR